MPGLTFRLDFETEALRSLELPIEVRRPNAALITTALSSETLDLPVGEYYATTRLPGGQRLVTPFTLTESAEQTPQPVVLAPDPEDASPHEWEEVTHFLGRSAAARQAASPSSAGPDQRYAAADSDSSDAATAWPAPQLCVYSGNVIRRTHVLESAPAVLGHGRADPGRLAQFDVPPGRELLVAQLVQPGGPVQNIALPRSPEVGVSLVVSLIPAGDHRIEARLANHTADMLLQYSGYGAATTATIAGRSWAVDGEQLLRAKSADPIAAAVGAYAILRVGDVTRLHDWTANLLEWFGWLPDGAAIYGEHLARMGRHADAVDAFAQIPARGLPFFSDGLFYAVERLRLYSNRKWKNAGRLDVSLARSVLDELEPFAPLMRRQRPVSTYPGLDVSEPDSASAPQDWSDALALDLHPLLTPVPSDAESKPS
jgi:hypothetical protein